MAYNVNKKKEEGKSTLKLPTWRSILPIKTADSGKDSRETKVEETQLNKNSNCKCIANKYLIICYSYWFASY